MLGGCDNRRCGDSKLSKKRLIVSGCTEMFDRNAVTTLADQRGPTECQASLNGYSCRHPWGQDCFAIIEWLIREPLQTRGGNNTGADAFLSKPFSTRELMEKIRSLLASRREA